MDKDVTPYTNVHNCIKNGLCFLNMSKNVEVKYSLIRTFAVVGVILYLENQIMLARINESLGEEVIGEGCDAIIGDVLEISTFPLVREMWQLLEKQRVFLFTT